MLQVLRNLPFLTICFGSLCFGDNPSLVEYKFQTCLSKAFSKFWQTIALNKLPEISCENTNLINSYIDREVTCMLLEEPSEEERKISYVFKEIWGETFDEMFEIRPKEESLIWSESEDDLKHYLFCEILRFYLLNIYKGPSSFTDPWREIKTENREKRLISYRKLCEKSGFYRDN